MVSTAKRLWAKALSWRFFSSLITLLVVWGVTRQFELGLISGGIEGFIKIFFYYGHERFWDRVKWGFRKQKSEYIKQPPTHTQMENKDNVELTEGQLLAQKTLAGPNYYPWNIISIAKEYWPALAFGGAVLLLGVLSNIGVL